MKDMETFDLKTTMSKLSTYMQNTYESKSERKPDFYSFSSSEFVCGDCGEKYKLFHFFHGNDRN